MASLLETLKSADDDILNEILREAESRLDAQLSAALAADGRAMNFLGFLAAIAVAIVGASLAVTATNAALAMIGLLTGGGLSLAGYFAFEAAKPIDFEMTGNYPSQWVGDITNRTSKHDALAAQVAYYDEMLKQNASAMSANAAILGRSADIAKVTLFLGCIAAVVYFFATFIESL